MTRVAIGMLGWVLLAGSAQAAPPKERRLHSDNVDASSFLWNDWNKFVENYHPNYVADDDPATAWVEGDAASGAGQWVRLQLTPLDATTRLRLKIRNGYQKSKELFAANARAKDITVRLLPSKVEKKATLVDRDGWQEVVIDQPSATVKAVEIAVGSVYEGRKYADLCISDVQVFATSETADNPAFEKSKREALLAWRSQRIAAAKLFTGKKLALPLYPAYASKQTKSDDTIPPQRGDLIAQAQKDPAFQKEWKDALALAAALEGSLDTMKRAQLAPASTQKLVAVDGLQITEVGDIDTGEGPYLEHDALRLPMLGTVASLFSDQLRVLDLADKQTVSQFQDSQKDCRHEVVWASRVASREATGPARVQALAVGRCQKLEGREGTYIGKSIELMVYDASGKLALVIGSGHLEAYRWTTEAGKPMLAGGRSLLWDSGVVEVAKRDAVANK